MANCPSFANRDCNAEFSQIFTVEMIDNLTEQESDLFETRYILEGICSSCGEDLSLCCRTLLNYVRIELKNFREPSQIGKAF